MELDPLTRGERVLPDKLAGLGEFQRVVWTVFHDAGRRRFRGWGWNESDPLPEVDWQIDLAHALQLNLAETLREAAAFNEWERLVKDASDRSGAENSG